MALSKSTIKYLQSLRLKKNRQKYNNFIVEGEKMSMELLSNVSFRVEAIYALPKWIETHQQQLRIWEKQINVLSPMELQRISLLKTPNKVLIVAKQKENKYDLKTVKTDWSLYLDGIQDPGNMGTILRIADWFGIPYVFRSPECVEMYNPKVIQASMGAFLRVQAPIEDLPSIAQQIPNLPIYGAVLNGENIFATSWPDKGIIVIGNEGNGISSTVQNLLTKKITIPKSGRGGAESLNVGVATGIICSVMRNKKIGKV